jgi:hypothetical protein
MKRTKLTLATLLSLSLGTSLAFLPAQEESAKPADNAAPMTLPGENPAPMPIIVGDGSEFATQASWAVPAIAQLRTDVMKLATDRKLAKPAQQQLESLWPSDEKTLDNTTALDRVAQSILLLEPAAADLIKLCSQHRSELLLPTFDILKDDKQPELIRNNLRLYFGRWLSQERYYEESLEQLTGLEPKAVCDPMSLLFYQSVNHHALLMKKEGTETLAKLFERRYELPKRFELVGRMMQLDLAALKEDSLDHVSRRMQDIARRMDFGRSGKKVQGEEKKVIAALDKLIEELEKEQNGNGGGGGGGGGGQGQGQGSGPPNGIQSNGPAADSNIARGKGDGNVTKKNIGSKSGWGDLPPKEREQALQQIGKEFPSHYRDVIEEYFRRMAESD